MINTRLFIRGDSEGGNCIISILFFPRKVSSFEHCINFITYNISWDECFFFFADWAISDKASVEE